MYKLFAKHCSTIYSQFADHLLTLSLSLYIYILILVLYLFIYLQPFNHLVLFLTKVANKRLQIDIGSGRPTCDNPWE